MGSHFISLFRKKLLYEDKFMKIIDIFNLYKYYRGD